MRKRKSRIELPNAEVSPDATKLVGMPIISVGMTQRKLKRTTKAGLITHNQHQD